MAEKKRNSGEDPGQPTGMPPGTHPGMPHGMPPGTHPGMPPGMHPGMPHRSIPPGMPPSMHPGAHPGVAMMNFMMQSEFFQAATEHSMAQMAFLDNVFNILWINESYSRAIGHNAAELTGRNYFEILPEEDKAPFEKARDTGQAVESLNKPFRSRLDPGITYWYETLMPIQDVDGNNEGLVLLRMDTTDRRESELQLERVAQEWRAVFDSVPDFISVHDTEYNILRVNRALAEALGAKPSDLIGRKCYEIFHDTNKPWPGCPHCQTMETKHTTQAEIFEPHLGMYLEIIAAPIFDKRSRLTGSVHVSRDVTPRRKAEDSLRESERRYRELADLLPQIVFEMDANLNISFANRQALEIAGYGPEDFEKGLSALDLLVPEYRTQAIQDIMLAMTDPQSQQFEFTLRRKDGSTFPASVFINPIMHEGKIDGLAGIVIDLTEQKKLEQLKDEFIGLVSHELRTPLTTIIGSVNMVLGAGQRLSRKDSQQLLGDAAAAAEELSDLLSNLLELSRVRAERLVLHKESVDIKTITREIVQRLKPRGPGYHFVVDIPKSLPPVPADPLRLERILHNLLENAVKYSPAGGEICITARKKATEILVSVSDQGRGISKADQSRLFAAFQRLDESKATGIGLGLLVCRRLVEAHHGRIWVESERGQGATFFFTLPLKAR